MINRRIVSFLVMALALPVLSPVGQAQTNKWEQIGQLGLGIQCGYFWSRDEGVVATGAAQFYYLKSGQVWKPSLKLPIPSTVNSIRSFDGKTLYATVQDRQSKILDQLWKSIDSGVTWTEQIPPPPANNASGTDNGPDVYLNYLSNSLVLMGSSDVRLDSLDIVSTWDFGGTAPPYTTRDGGRTWGKGSITGPPFLSYNYLSGIGACVDLTNKIYYAAADNGAPGMFRSTDSGRTWTTISSLPQNLYMMDDVEGIYDKTFIQTSNGLYETTDSGNTWNSIGGPSRQTSDDARFFVFGCTGQAVVAFGDNGAIDILNGWDAPDPNQIQSTFSATAKECDSATILINVDPNFEPGRLLIQIENNTDSPFKLLSPDTITLTSGLNQIVVQFKGIDILQHSALLSITSLDYGACPVTHLISGQAHILPPAIISPKPVLACAALSSQFLIANPDCELLHITSESSASQNLIPISFDSIIADTAALPFTCKMLSQQGKVMYPVHIEGYFEPSNMPVDTTVSVTINYDYTPSTLIPSYSQCDIGSLNACLSSDTSFVIQNSGCDTLWVPLALDTLTDGWTLAPSSDTLQLLPGQSDTILVHFSSSIPGSHNRVLSYSYLGAHSGIVPIELTANVTATPPVVGLSDIAVDLGSRTICENDTILDITFTTSGCDSTEFSNYRLFTGTSFQLLNPDDTVIPPYGILQKQIIYHPGGDGSQSQSMTVHISRTDGSFGRDTSVTFSVNVTGNRDKLQSLTLGIDAGQTHICEERDTFVVIQNIGCDTACVSSVSIAPSGFVITNGGGSFCIPPGSYDTIWLRTQIDTTGRTPANNSLLTIVTDTLPNLAPIALSREIVYPSPWSLSLSVPDSCYAGEGIAYKIFQHGLISADATGVDMDVTFNDDMLKLTGIDEPSISQAGYYRDGAGIAHYLLHVSPVTSDSVLATLHFFAYQTRAASTAIAINSIQINSSDASLTTDCIANITLASSAFSIKYACDSPLLADELNGLPLNFSIEPNPAIDIANVRYSLASSSPANATIFIEDALGRIAFSNSIFLMPGNGNSLALDLSNLAAGVYCVRIGLSNEEESVRVIKE